MSKKSTSATKQKPYLKLTPTAKKIVRQAIKNIMASPAGFCMAHWNAKDTACGTSACLAGHLALATGLPARFNRHYEDVYYNPKRVSKLLGIDVDSFAHNEAGVHSQELSNLVLGIDGSSEDALYHVHNWPDEFRQRFEALGENLDNNDLLCRLRNADCIESDKRLKPTPKEQKLFKKRAKLAVDRLKHFIQTGE